MYIYIYTRIFQYSYVCNYIYISIYDGSCLPHLFVPKYTIARLPFKVLFALHVEDRVICHARIGIFVGARTEAAGKVATAPTRAREILDVVVEQELVHFCLVARQIMPVKLAPTPVFLCYIYIYIYMYINTYIHVYVLAPTPVFLWYIYIYICI